MLSKRKSDDLVDSSDTCVMWHDKDFIGIKILLGYLTDKNEQNVYNFTHMSYPV